MFKSGVRESVTGDPPAAASCSETPQALPRRSVLAGLYTRGMFASLANRDYLFLWVASLGANFAMQMQVVARGWLIYAMTSSPLALTWVLLAFSAPTLVFSLMGGVMADRLPKKRLMIVAQSINCAATLVLAWIVITDQVTFQHFIYFGLLNGVVLSLSMPARQAIIPEIVGESQLFNAMALSTASMNLSRVLGPALAGVTIALLAQGDTSSTLGVGMVFFIIAALYLVSVLCLTGVGYRRKPSTAVGQSVLKDILQGLSYIRHSRSISALLLMSFVPLLFGMPIHFLMPAFNQDILQGGPDDLGLLLGVQGVGALIGSLLVARMDATRHKGNIMLVTCFIWALTLAGFSMTTSLSAALVMVALVGLCSSLFMAINMSLIQLAVKAEMRGRVMSVLMMTFGLMPLGVLPVGAVAEWFGIDLALLVSALGLALVTLLIALFFPVVRRIDKGRGPAAGG